MQLEDSLKKQRRELYVLSRSIELSERELTKLMKSQEKHVERKKGQIKKPAMSAIHRAAKEYVRIEDFCKVVNVSRATYYNWLNGAYMPSPDAAKRIEYATNGKVKARDIRPDVNFGDGE